MKVIISHHSVLKGEADKQYVVYHVTVNYDGVIWEVCKRYSEIEKLHNALSKIINTKKFGKFPKKYLVGNLKEDKIHERQIELQNYFDNLLSEPLVPTLQEIIEFFEVNKHWNEIKTSKGGTFASTSSQSQPSQVVHSYNQTITVQVESSNTEVPIYNIIDSNTSQQGKSPTTIPSPSSNQNVEEEKNNNLQQNKFMAIRDHFAKDETELSFKAGNIIEVIQKGSNDRNEEDCYWYGRMIANGSQGFFDARCLDLGNKAPRIVSVLMNDDVYDTDDSVQLDGTIKTIEIDYEAEGEGEVSVQRGQKVKILPSSRQTRKGYKLVEVLSDSCQTVTACGYIPTEYVMIF
ncbi:hypothetical protein C9374_001419 [Naegleria lovaniensis]|uniref:PX domain-containing protein n=1 Tax=Naegleria lovaniensis TaxID=51637 RepID=A0AA88GVR4_NAELO|nr:uncharacterized protein C9374_001419 [Naegleria lovaniensis]KAG2387825.1 hypothetical protein C9374_001419 [Naegleria lovaniensis]